MSRPGGEPSGRGVRRRPGSVLLTALAVLAAAWAPAAAPAQQVPATGAPDLTRQVQESLLRLQDGWLQWTGALYGGDPERALEAVDDLLATADRLGLGRLPDLAAGAMVQAVEAAREGEPERVDLALEAAERLDPGRPEISFARAEVARLEGRPVGRVVAQLTGFARVLGPGALRTPALLDVALWSLVVLLVAGALFVALLMASAGRPLIEDLGGWLDGRLPKMAVQPLVVALLVWPLLLPWGPLWLVLYWSLLLWRWARPSERAVVVGLWLLLGSAPWLVDRAQAQLALELSPPVRAVDSIVEDRLYGSLFTDLGVLPATLPESPAVDHLLADLHVRLGQWELARRRYEAVLADEPENVPALIGLGAYHFHRGDLGSAIAMFQEAIAVDPDSAAAYFDLSVAYTESNLFAENRQALLEARRADDLRVSEWMRRPEDERIVVVEGGLVRRGEIEDALAEAWRPPDGASPALVAVRGARSLLMLAGLGILGLAFSRVGGRLTGGARSPRNLRRKPGHVAASVVPGFAPACAGRGFAALAAVLLPAALLVMLAAAAGPGFGFSVPWRYDPGDWLLLWASAAGLAGLVAVRVARALWRGRG